MVHQQFRSKYFLSVSLLISVTLWRRHKKIKAGTWSDDAVLSFSHNKQSNIIPNVMVVQSSISSTWRNKAFSSVFSAPPLQVDLFLWHLAHIFIFGWWGRKSSWPYHQAPNNLWFCLYTVCLKSTSLCAIMRLFTSVVWLSVGHPLGRVKSV